MARSRTGVASAQEADAQASTQAQAGAANPLGSLGGDGSAENALPVLGSLAIGGVAAGIALAVSNGAIQLPQI